VENRAALVSGAIISVLNVKVLERVGLSVVPRVGEIFNWLIVHGLAEPGYEVQEELRTVLCHSHLEQIVAKVSV